MDKCAYCRRQGQLQRCSRCHFIKYCSKQCQTSDWNAHKATGICRKDGLPLVNLAMRQQDVEQYYRTSSADAQPKQGVAASDVGSVNQSHDVPAKQTPRQVLSLSVSRIDMSLRDGRWLQYYSDECGLSELDLSTYIGNDDGKLVWGSKDFHLTTKKAQLVNGHVLVARLYRTDKRTLTESWINLDKYIHCDEEVLEYDSERGEYGERLAPWTTGEYRIFDPPGEGEVNLSPDLCVRGLTKGAQALYQKK